MKALTRLLLLALAAIATVALVTRHTKAHHRMAPFTTAPDAAIQFHEYELDNGLRVILAPDEMSRTVTVSVTYDVGSRDESEGKSGLAHLCEHLIFKGSRTLRRASTRC